MDRRGVLVKCDACGTEMEVWPGPSGVIPPLIHDPLGAPVHIIAWPPEPPGEQERP